jgi:NAD(P)-dependent dehydrogenase (short-subunit alcohol dehydrogenase family)
VSPPSDALASLFDFSGRVAVVTGAATGIGEAIARTLADAGASVVIADIDLAGARRVAGDIDGVALELDVTDADACARVLGGLGEPIDILVNNAGSYHDAGSILDQSVASWHRAVDVNLASLFHCCKPVAERMVARGAGGAIVNIASVDGLLPCLGTGYDSAKAGAIHFTRSLAVDLAPHGIRVNTLCPTFIETPLTKPFFEDAAFKAQVLSMIRLGRLGQVEDLMGAIVFLCSDAAALMTGSSVVVDGGWTAA